MIKQDLKQITSKLATDDLEQSDEEDLFQELRDKRAIKKNHESELAKLESQTDVRVNYSVIKTGVTAVLPPGLTLQPQFLSEPVCWCPHNMPAAHPVEETTSMSEVMAIISSDQCTATGAGLEEFTKCRENKFVVTTRDMKGHLCEVSVDNFAIESKEVEIEASVVRKEIGKFEVSYAANDFQDCKEINLAVTHLRRHIKGSPFSVRIGKQLLLEFSSSDNHTQDWLDP